MSDGKLRLNLAALRLKSFETTPDTGGARGTVLGMDSECSQCTGCTQCTLATYGCSQATNCGAVSCWQSGGCPGASATDSTGPNTQYCEPETWYCSEWDGCPESNGCTYGC